MVYLYKYRLKEDEKKDSLRFIRDSLKKRFSGSEEINVYKDSFGRPMTDREGVFVSATHTGDIVVCAVSESPA